MMEHGPTDRASSACVKCVSHNKAHVALIKGYQARVFLQVTDPGSRSDFLLMLGRFVLYFSAFLLLSSSGHEWK